MIRDLCHTSHLIKIVLPKVTPGTTVMTWRENDSSICHKGSGVTKHDFNGTSTKLLSTKKIHNYIAYPLAHQQQSSTEPHLKVRHHDTVLSSTLKNYILMSLHAQKANLFLHRCRFKVKLKMSKCVNVHTNDTGAPYKELMVKISY